MLKAVILSHYFAFYEVVQERDALRKKKFKNRPVTNMIKGKQREPRSLVLTEQEEATSVPLQVTKEKLRK